MRQRLLCAALVAVMLLAAAGCSMPWSKSPESKNPPDTTQPETVSVTLYFADKNAEYLIREVRTVPKEANMTKDEIAIRELIKGPANPSLSKTVPVEAKLLSLRIENGVAYANFSKEIQTKHWGGSTGELMTTASIINTLTENPAIKQVQFLLEGKVEPSIWGHGITDQPIGRNEKIIKK